MNQTGKRRKRRVKKYLTVLIALLILAIAGTIGLGIWKESTKEEKPEKTQTSTEEKKPSSNTVVFQGKEYEYNDHLSNFLFLGIDKREKIETNTGGADAGQADAIFLLSGDRVKHQMSMVTIPRDTITQIEVFDQNGNSLGMTKDHINLAYAYGDGKNVSCNLMKQAVSNLLYGLPIQGYCSIDMDGIPVMIDAIGGVTVTIPNDSLEEENPQWKKGSTVELTADNAETFVRYRSVSKSQSALERMERQIAFLSAYGEKATQVYSETPSLVTDLYEKLNNHMITNIGTDEFIKVLQDFSRDEDKQIWSIPGKGVEGQDFDEYHVDDQELYKKVIQYFYDEVE